MFKFKLRENERVIYAGRQSEWVWGKTVVLVLLSIYLPWAFYAKYELWETGALRQAMLIWTVAVSLFAANKYLLWLVNAQIVTNQRAVSIFYSSLVSKTVEEASLQSITSVSVVTKGFLDTMASTGKLVLTLANSPKQMEFNKVKNPEKLKEQILKARATEGGRHA